MKIVRKITMLMLSVCLVLPCFSMFTYAANGKIMFTDHPSAVVGETLNVRGAIEAESALEDMTVRMTYDTSMLKFTGGENVRETSAGELRFEIKGQVHGTRVQYNMSFDVLKEGTTQIKLLGYDIWLDSDEKIVCQEGYSTINIAEGESTSTEEPEQPEEPQQPEESEQPETPSEGINVDVNGVTYTFTDKFTAEDIPEGFTETTIEFEGAQRKVVHNADSDIILGYLVNGENAGKFYMYIRENATFTAFEQVVISENTTIALLSDTTEVNLPEQYRETAVTLNGQEFPAWQDENDASVCILHAVNNRGEKSLYRLDIEEGTYQRFEVPEQIEEEKEDSSMFGQLSSFLKNHLDYVILVTGFGFILLVLVIIILSVKLYNRNAELDELYEEYGIDLDDDDNESDVDEIEEVEEDEEVEEIEGIEEIEEVEEIEEIEEIEDEEELKSEEDVEEDSLPIFEDLEELFADFDEVIGDNTQEAEPVEIVKNVETVEDSLFEEEVLEVPVQETEKDDFYDDDDLYDDFDVDFIDLDD